MNKPTNKEIGKKLELKVLSYIQEVLPTASLTKASGAKSQKGDIATGSLRFKVECKYRETDNCTINRKVWNKLCGELNTYHNDTPLLVLGNKHDEIFAVLDIKNFIRLLKNALHFQEK